ncbi:hypothetical protein KC340_g163 [Hortaea werneckii]|nr:hypothetical protein KC340_g163 [Hortaea werneckii]
MHPGNPGVNRARQNLAHLQRSSQQDHQYEPRVSDAVPKAVLPLGIEDELKVTSYEILLSTASCPCDRLTIFSPSVDSTGRAITIALENLPPPREIRRSNPNVFRSKECFPRRSVWRSHILQGAFSTLLTKSIELELKLLIRDMAEEGRFPWGTCRGSLDKERQINISCPSPSLTSQLAPAPAHATTHILHHAIPTTPFPNPTPYSHEKTIGPTVLVAELTLCATP